MTEEHPSGERRLMNNELHEQEEQPHFEHVAVKEEPSFNESTLIKEEVDPVQMKEELDSDDEQPFMSPVREESALDKNRVALNVPVVDVVQEEVSSHCSSDRPCPIWQRLFQMRRFSHNLPTKSVEDSIKEPGCSLWSSAEIMIWRLVPLEKSCSASTSSFFGSRRKWRPLLCGLSTPV